VAVAKERSGKEAAFYLLVAISFTLCLVPEFAEEEKGEKAGYSASA
jgi:hypothetical protein